jgi:hypothetical protein
MQRIITTIKKKSPTLFINMALAPLLTEGVLVPQNVINKKEQTPTPSQPINIVIKFEELTKITMKKENK